MRLPYLSRNTSNVLPSGKEFRAISPDTSLVVTTPRSSRTVDVWNLRGEKVMEFSGSQANIKSLALSPDNSTLAVIREDRKTKLWQLSGLDDLMKQGCNRVREYLNNPHNDLSKSDRRLCDGILSTGQKL